MKQSLRVMMISIFLSLASVQKSSAQMPVVNIIKAAIKKVIKATDLMVQRLQNKTILLQNAQRLLENEMSKLKLTEIGDWVNKQKQLYSEYFEELKKVKNVIASFNRVRQIIQKQAKLVTEYHAAYNKSRQDQNFTVAELDYMQQVYGGILQESLKNLEQLFLVVNSFSTQMSDAKRLEFINEASLKIDADLTALRQFNQQNFKISLQRAKEKHDIDAFRKLYQLN
jgi:hypothetical protein